MEKKRLLFFVFICIFLFSFSGAFHAETAHGKTINLSFAHIFPASHYQNTEVFKQYVEEIEKAILVTVEEIGKGAWSLEDKAEELKKLAKASGVEISGEIICRRKTLTPTCWRGRRCA